MKHIIILLLLIGCATGKLTTLGRDETTVHTKGNTHTIIKEYRNPFAYSAIILFFPVSITIDILVSPYYFYQWLIKGEFPI